MRESKSLTSQIGFLVNHGYLFRKRHKKDVMYFTHYVFTSSGGRTRTYDLRVMSPTSYQLLYSAMYSLIGLQRYGLKSIYANYFYPTSAIQPIK